MKGQRATVPPIEKVYFYCAQEERCFWNYIAVYFNRLHVLAVCFKHILLQNFPPSQCTCIDGMFSSNMDTFFVQYGLELEYIEDIFILLKI